MVNRAGAKYDVLFEPIQIGPKRARNRFYKAPHGASFGTYMPLGQACFRGMAAEGGWAVVNTEYCSIHPECDSKPSVESRLWDEDDVRNLSRMCEVAHEHDALAGVELWYGGAHGRNFESRLAARGASQAVSDYNRLRSCYEMSKTEIRGLQGFYVDAAVRARAAGFDLINVYGGHDLPITAQFLAHAYNRRTDEYGGSLVNRSRFWRETLELVRAEVGDDCAVVARVCLDSLRPGGVTIDETLEFIELADHLVDLWDLQLGGGGALMGRDMLASRFGPENNQAEYAIRVRPHTAKPLVGVGRFTDPDTMVAVIQSRQLDMIGAARPSIADPFLPAKIADGRFDDIRECIGCNACQMNSTQGLPIICTQNATAGEEYRRGWHPEKFTKARNADKSVLVVGAGPAGMECAMVLGKRGMHHVRLVDARDDMGGTMCWIPALPGLGDWSRLVDYRRVQLGKLSNVEFISRVTLAAHDVVDYGADVVIIATGALWAGNGVNFVSREPIPGADATLPHIVTPDQIMRDRKPIVGHQVLIYDCDGYFMAASLAEKLRRDGHDVVIVSPHTQIAPFMFFTAEGAMMNRLLVELGVELVTSHRVDRIDGTTVIGSHIYSPERSLEWNADSILLVTERHSNDQLYHEILRVLDPDAERQKEVFRIGDCVAPRLLVDVVFDGHRLAREIDSPNPAIALPYLRETKLLAASLRRGP